VGALRSVQSIFMVAALLCLTPLGSKAAPAAPNSRQDQDTELQLGQEVFNELKARTEIIESPPLYDQLRPVAEAITRAAQPRYNHPFKFYLVHEAQPNAFATPGGNVYVVDSLLYCIRNTEELAGTLCHEVSHTIHHDTVTLMEKRKKIAERGAGAAILLGPSQAHVLAIALLGQLHSLSYSRDVESRADLTGSDICAAAGYNPWGLVWLFRDFDKADVGQVRSSCQIIPVIRIGWMRSSNTSVTTRRSSESSTRTQSRRRGSWRSKRLPKCSYVERAERSSCNVRVRPLAAPYRAGVRCSIDTTGDRL